MAFNYKMFFFRHPLEHRPHPESQIDWWIFNVSMFIGTKFFVKIGGYLMEELKAYVGKKIMIEISGKINHIGILIDIGSDILVIYNGNDYLYVPFIHIQHINCDVSDEEIKEPHSPSILDPNDQISLRKIANNAKGVFVEIFVTSNKAIHGYITNVMNDYIVFYSPVYKTMFIPLQHLKWLIPYYPNQTPYRLDRSEFPVSPTKLTLARTCEEQLQKLRGRIVVFDLGLEQHRIGQLRNIKDNFIELITARDQTIYLNLRHIKTIHFLENDLKTP
jgi:hypothetical protein